MSSMFSKATPPTPTVAPPAPMPDASSAEVTEAKRKAQLGIMGRAGRSSTILTAPEQRPNATYTATRLGTSA